MKKDKIRAELVSFQVENDFSGTAEKTFLFAFRRWKAKLNRIFSLSVAEMKSVYHIRIFRLS